MTRFLLSIASVLLVALAIAGPAEANPITISWTDTSNSWGTSYGGSSASGGTWGISSENGTDVIGGPDITGGLVTISNTGYLISISYNFTNWPSLAYPSDLFLDTNNNGAWDYVLSVGYNSDTDYLNDFPNIYEPSMIVGLYAINFNALNYLVTGLDGSGYWSGYNIRNNQPYGYLVSGSPLGTGSSASFGSPGPSSGTFTYTLPTNIIAVSGPLTFGFDVSCANDVVLATITPTITPPPPTVPEPGTILLLGTGLIGVAIFCRKKLGR